jgi:hypothetical protein
VVAVAWTSVIFVEASKILIETSYPYSTLAIAIVGGIPVIVSTFFTVLLLRRRYSDFSKGEEDSLEDLEER